MDTGNLVHIPSPRMKRNFLNDQTRAAWLLGAPALAIIAVFMLIPFLMSIGFSFTNKMLVENPNNPFRFVGLENFVSVFDNEIVKKAFLNTFLYTLIVVPVTIPLSVILAVLMNRPLRGIAVFRLIIFSPQVVSTTVVAIIWWFVLSPSPDGLFNSFLKMIGLNAQIWLKDSNLAMPCIAVMSIWQAVGMQMLIVLGGLQFIPHELYEAATMDGCLKWQSFLYITVPMLKNTLYFILVTMTINSLKLFTQVFVLTEGGPRDSTVSIVYLMYTTGFERFQVGYASSMAVVFFVLVLVISLIQNKIMTKGD